MFLLTPDAPRTGMGLAQAAGGGWTRLKATLAELPRLPSLGRFLLANMVYQDALVALFAFGGIYGAGVFGWQTIELGVFGILLTVTGTLGAWLGGKLDDRIGGKPVVLGAIGCLLLACLGILSLGRETVFFVISAAPATTGDGLFASAPEQVYLALGLLIGLVAGPLQASSRSLMARLAPEGRTAEFFGLFALSGKVTSFMGPTLVALATTIFASQRAGLAVLVVFFLVGGVLLAGVRVQRAK